MTLEEAFREMESNLEEADQEELEEDFLSWREEVMETLEKAISTYNPKNIRYFYFPYNGEIACIPEWFICRHRPKNMVELMEVAQLWLERNKRGDFGEDFEDWVADRLVEIGEGYPLTKEEIERAIELSNRKV